jgi:hypothetical protein
MWMVHPNLMCDQHLLGEHFECHMIRSHLEKKYKISGFIKSNCMEVRSLGKRHNALAKEMRRRGMKHKSPLKAVRIGYLPKEHRDAKVNSVSAHQTLVDRCARCLARASDG